MIKINNDQNKTNLETIEKHLHLIERNPHYKIGEYPKKLDPNIFLKIIEFIKNTLNKKRIEIVIIMNKM